MARYSTANKTNSIRIQDIFPITPTRSQKRGIKVAPTANRRPPLPTVGMCWNHQAPIARNINTTSHETRNGGFEVSSMNRSPDGYGTDSHTLSRAIYYRPTL